MRDGVVFVHAADLHLDAPFVGISAEDARVGSVLADATYRAFERVIDVCIERSADFLVIAGDVYNSADRSLRAQLRFSREMERLAEAGIGAFVAHGNHDPASGWSAGLRLPETVRVFPTDRVARFEVERDGEVVAAVYGRSFGRAAETDNLARGFSRQEGEPVAVAVLHANVGGQPDHDPYAPASLDDLRAARMDYWALGHIHKQQELSRDPWAVYPGSPQGLNPKETGSHGCAVVTVSGGGALDVEYVECAAVTWHAIGVDVSSAGSIDDVRRALRDECERVRREAACAVVARVTLTGRTPAHAGLARPGVIEDLFGDVRTDLAAETPWLWLDRLADRTRPEIDIDAVRRGADFASEAVRVADELAADPAALAALISGIAEPVAATLPGYEPAIDAEELLALARDGALDLLLADGEVA